MRTLSIRFLLVVSSIVVLAGVAGCSEEGGGRPGGRRDAGGGDTGESGAQCSDGIDNDMDGLADCDELGCRSAPECARDSGPRPDTGFGECDTVDFAAETALAPVDIVWIIDNSGSMGEETTLIQSNINSFAATISASGIDYHVVVVTQSSAFGLTVPPPLGTDTERLRMVEHNVQSSDALSELVNSYPMWSDFLRPSSMLHFIHVTDDESDMSDTDFFSQMTARLGGRPFTSHAICSLPADARCPVAGFCPPLPLEGCSGPHGDAPATGQEYVDIAMRTGGQALSICSSDWSMVFDRLLSSIAIPMPIPCEFRIPEPPEGMTFDRNRVNVLYTPGGGGAAITFPYVGQPDGSVLCPASGYGWYYDDYLAPTQIILCPATCDLVDADTSGTVNIALGCETIFG